MLDSLRALDWNVVRLLVEYGLQHPWFAMLAVICAEMLILVFIPVLYGLWRSPQPLSAHQGNKKAVVLALLSLVFAVALKSLIALLFFRARPFISHPELLVANLRVDPQSFPSGHTLIAATVTASLAFSGMRKLTPWLIIVTLLVAFGRIATGVHYPSDVIGAIIFGTLSAWFLHHESSGIKHYLPNS
jgi:undecaprenyl-diphosphatase